MRAAGIFASMERGQVRNLIAAVACLTVFDVAMGITFTLLSLILEARGIDEHLIGLNAAMGPIGIIVAGPLVPVLARRFGTVALARGLALMTAAVLVLLRLFPDLGLWFVLRFFLGAGAGCLFAISESWIVQFAEGPYRGRIIAVYTSILSAGFAIGPFIIPLTGVESWTPFILGVGLMVAAYVVMGLIGAPTQTMTEKERSSFWGFFFRAPVLLAGVGVFAILDAATLSFLPIYGLRKGLDLATASIALGVMIGGNVFLQIPIGWLAERLPRPLVMTGCAVVAAASLFALPAAMGTVWMWPLVMSAGAAGFGV